MSTTATIFVALMIKGALVVFLRKRGWWPDWVARAHQREEEKLVLAAYRKWRRDAGPDRAADMSLLLKNAAKGERGVRTFG